MLSENCVRKDEFVCSRKIMGLLDVLVLTCQFILITKIMKKKTGINKKHVHIHSHWQKATILTTISVEEK